MLLRLISESIGNYRVERFSEDADNYDPWQVADEAEKAATSSGIHISRMKELTFVALTSTDECVGGIWVSTYVDGEDDDGEKIFVYDFDVAVHPKARGFIGLKLIEAAIDDFKNGGYPYDKFYIKAWVINARLVRVLERKYGFEIQSDYGDGGAHMVYYG